MKKETIKVVIVLFCIALITGLAFSVGHTYQLRHHIDRSIYQSLSGINHQLAAMDEAMEKIDAADITKPQIKKLIDDFYYGCYSNAMAIKEFKWANKIYAKYNIFDVALYAQWLKYEYADRDDMLTPAIRKKIFASLREISSTWDDCLAHYKPNYDFRSDPRGVTDKIKKVNEIATEYQKQL